MSFDEEFNDMFLFKSMDIKRGGVGKFNEDMIIPKSILSRLGTETIKSKNNKQASFSFIDMFHDMKNAAIAMHKDMEASKSKKILSKEKN